MAVVSLLKGLKDDITENGVFQGSIDTYLQNNMTSEGTALHWGVIAGSGLLQRSRNDVNSPKRVANPYLKNTVDMLPTLTSLALDNDFMKEVIEGTYSPNIEGIPISSAEISSTRDVDVADYGVIVQQARYKQNIIDNSVPRPRTWTISGYLTSCLDTDHGNILKPSLILQKKILDAFTKARRPLWFKTEENEFVRVLITSLNITRTPDNMNTYPIQCSLKEFVPLENIEAATGKFRKAFYVLTH